MAFSAIECGGAQGTPSAAKSSPTIAPDFTARDVQGRTFRLSDHLGKEVILLDFWATYCEPCKAEFPHLRALYEQSRDRGFLIVGIAMDGPESSAEVPAFVNRYSLTFPVVLDDDSSIAGLYNPKRSMPLSVLVDRNGHVVRVREGYNPGDERLVKEDVLGALAAASPGL